MAVVDSELELSSACQKVDKLNTTAVNKPVLAATMTVDYCLIKSRVREPDFSQPCTYELLQVVGAMNAPPRLAAAAFDYFESHCYSPAVSAVSTVSFACFSLSSAMISLQISTHSSQM